MKSGVHRSLDGLSFSQIPKLAKPMMVAINIAHQCSPMSYSLYAGFHTGFFVVVLFFLGGGGGNVLVFCRRRHGCMMQRIAIGGPNLEKIPIKKYWILMNQ